jgi:hypothetical protein
MSSRCGLRVVIALFGFLLLSSARPAQAGVFNLSRFVEPSRWALGLEPGVQLTQGAGVAVEGKFTFGLSELSNVQAFLGTGGGGRRFRVGGAMTFDFFPDIDSQPGIGVAVQGAYVRRSVDQGEVGGLDVLIIPYLHKAFRVGSASEFEPFVALPFGSSFQSGTYQGLWSLSAGSHFKASENIRTTLEVTIAIRNTESAISGGLTYYH